MNSYVISFSWFCLLGTKLEITGIWRDNTPSLFSWTVLSACKRGKGQSIIRNLNLQPGNERTRSRVFPTTFLQNSFLLVSYEKYPLPYCNSGSIFYLMENKKGRASGIMGMLHDSDVRPFGDSLGLIQTTDPLLGTSVA